MLALTCEVRLLNAEIITIGAELLKGSTLNTNAQFLGKELTALGFNVHTQTSCEDSLKAIGDYLNDALQRSELIILSGGLGPTPDDLTRDAIAQFFGVKLKVSKAQFDLIKKFYQKRGKKVPDIVKKEAAFPENSRPLINRHGVALGFSIEVNHRLIVVLPGVPSELRKMFEELVKPLVKKIFKRRMIKKSFVVKTVGLSEPSVMMKLKKDFFDDPHEFGIYPDSGEVTVRIQCDTEAILKRLKTKVKKRLEPYVYAYEETSLAKTVGELLQKKKRTLAVAESCTGGLLSSMITVNSGATKYFKGGVTAYSNALKESLLGVSKETLKKFGAVSSQVAKELAKNAKQKLASDYALGITGIAGPGGGTKEKPVGLVYVGIATPKGVRVKEYRLWGDRPQIQKSSAKKALHQLWLALK